ncbi:LysE family transporter [Candidatus Methanocrinis natronophilus]|uniref:LysE family transporter n=1 Tax=Candidatus Methanocrinis natronophilus TaxID=3033396 RepID=A0ABT5X7D8_9EURY|nr:LysE family transporter [Candidatus Methanocrinis natronophilus]MDF0590605.1 LysE family transporter [Candidatus Methanocrinis natronophilus]
MLGAIETLILAFAIGLTGALAPGPTLVATINSSLQRGWTVGPKVATGHAIAEMGVFLMIALGVATVVEDHTATVAVVGGSALILFGLLTMKGSRTATMKISQGHAASNPYIAGALTSVSNPYFWIWWMSIGSALVLAELREGLLLAMIFMIGHWGADYGWYTFVSTSLHRGRTFLSEANYRRVLALCGAFLVLFGASYLFGAWSA